MKKIFSTTEIDRFFNHLKEQLPIYTDEKVHQIINSPEAKARLKGKSQNLLKFTIMTTIFAVILSAVLLWTGNDREITKSEKQDSNTVLQTKPSSSDLDGEGSTNNNKDLSLTNSLKNKKENEAEKDASVAPSGNSNDTKAHGSVDKIVSNTGTEAQYDSSVIEKPSQQNVPQPVGLMTNTIEPIDGSRFVLQLTNEELKGIGFQITDSSIVFEDLCNDEVYKYGSFRRKIKGTWKFDGDKSVLVSDTGFRYDYYSSLPSDKIDSDAASINHFDYYPICTTNKHFANNIPILKNNCCLPSFDMLNDTLLPIIFPSLDGVSEERIIWFVLTGNLYDLLKQEHKAVLDELIKYKQVKKYHQYEDLIIYKSPFFVEEGKTIKLDTYELEKLGFKFFNDSTTYNGRWLNYSNSMESNYKRARWSVRDDLPKIDEKEGLIALLVSDGGGSLLGYGNKPFLFFESLKDENIIPTLIPVEVKVVGFYKSKYFWFLPTEGFFNALPDNIGNALRKEYNYITAEDKSTLEKPVCKYFDECKNTLKVSGFKVFPNPANDKASVSFTLPEEINGRITLVDLAGRERQVLQPQTSFAKGSHQIDVNVSSVPEGIYLLTLYSDKGVQTQRLVVAR
jgi:hypothetical protein